MNGDLAMGLATFAKRSARRAALAAGYDLQIEPRMDRMTQQERVERQRRAREEGVRGFLEGVLEEVLTARGKLSIAQVGANDGVLNDPLYDFNMSNMGSTRVLLIEPQADLLDDLKENYREHPDATVLQVAIGKPGRQRLFRIRPEYEDRYSGLMASGVTSASEEHVRAKAQKLSLSGRSPDDLVEAFEVESVDLVVAMERGNFGPSLDVLQIDTEGFDDEVIYASEIDRLRPAVISYERALLSQERYEQLSSFLDSRDYRRVRSSAQDECALLALA